MPLIWQQLFIPRSCRLPGAETPVCWGAAGSAVRYPGGPHLGWPRHRQPRGAPQPCRGLRGLSSEGLRGPLLFPRHAGVLVGESEGSEGAHFL